MEQYNVEGMSCAACVARVEKAVNSVEGVTSCAVSLLTNSMGVEGNVDPKKIMDAVEKAGYKASLKGAVQINNHASEEEALEDHETPKLKKRLVYSLGFLIVLMYFSMGKMMFNLPLPKFFEECHLAIGLVELLLTIVIMMINNKFFVSGFKSLANGAPNMDTLVALGSGASFVYSVYALFMMADAVTKGDHMLAMSYMDQFYFESAAMILTLITVGKMLEANSKGKTTTALKSLMKLAPKNATVLINEVEKVVPIEQVQIGDLFVVKPGENVPVDGVVVSGSSAINESSLTGESVPVDKVEGDIVSAATINQSGHIICRATRVGNDTSLSQIIKMVSDAAATKAPIAKIADQVSGVFVPAVICISIVTTVVWMLLGQSFGYALARGISVLVISCPCALGLATPVAIMVGNGVGAKNGILFKNAVSLEKTGKTQIVVLDKTGTITEGQPVVTDIVCNKDVIEEELLKVAVSVEGYSEHPLAKAIVSKGEQANVETVKVENFQALAGHGISGVIDNETVLAGSVKFISSKYKVENDLLEKAEVLSSEGKTPMMFVKADKVLGVIAVADTIKSDSPEAIKQLREMGIRVIMLTGDNEKTAKAIGNQAGVDAVVASVLPDGKAEIVNKLKEYGQVAMVGDGINDAVALTYADTGIAIGAGSDVAIDAADVVLMKSSLLDVVGAIRLSKSTLVNIKENLFWAFIYNVIGIPLAAGCYVKLGLELNPMFGAAAMSLSSFCVVSNALRLNVVKLYSNAHDRKIKNSVVIDYEGLQPKKEETSMTKTMVIEGMMCMHCQARVKKALEAVENVTSAEVSFETGTAVVTMSSEVSNEVLTNAVEAQDYKVVEVK